MESCPAVHYQCITISVIHIHLKTTDHSREFLNPIQSLLHSSRSGVSRWIFFLFLDKNVCCGYSLEAPRWGASNKYPQHMFSWKNKKNINIFPEKKVPYLELCLLMETSGTFHVNWKESCGNVLSTRQVNGVTKQKSWNRKFAWLPNKWINSFYYFLCLCWGFTAQSTQWGHVERGQFT